jgi:hypothetical protein
LYCACSPQNPPPPDATRTPVSASAAAGFFSYALPEGWRVGEDGQFALTLIAPDNKAITMMVEKLSS